MALSIVGCDAIPDSGYMRAKVTQEKTISDSGIPYSIVRATQFSEFTDGITDSLTVGDQVRVPDALIQPIPSDQVAAAVAEAAVHEPRNGIVNVGGSAKITFEEMAHDVLSQRGDTTTRVIVDPEARYYGALLNRTSLVTPD